MLNKKQNAKLLWMQFEDVLAPRLGLTVKERAVYSYLLRHSLVVGKLRLQFAVMSLARTLGLSIGAARQAVRRLDELGALRVLERGNTGHLAEMRLPERRRCKTRKDGRPARLLPLAFSLERAPGIDDSNAAIGKVGAIPCCKLSPVRPGNGCDLGVRVADGSSKRPAVCCNPCKMLRSVALECEYTSREVFRKHPFRCSQQAVAPLTFGEQFDSVKDFRLRDRGRKEVCQRLLGDPYRDSGGRFRPHEFRQHIRIEDDHSPNPGALRTASRRGKEILIPPNDANRRRIASARFPLVREEVVKAERKISRASSSIERPWWAARTRKRVLVFWSSCRMVSAAMSAMIALLASDAKRPISAELLIH